MADAEPTKLHPHSGRQGSHVLPYQPSHRVPQQLANLDRFEPGSLKLHLRFDEGGPKGGAVNAKQIVDKSSYAALNNPLVSVGSGGLTWSSTPQGGWGVKFPGADQTNEYIEYSHVPWMWPSYTGNESFLFYCRYNTGSLNGTTANLGACLFQIYGNGSSVVGWPFIKAITQADRNWLLQWVGDNATSTWTNNWYGSNFNNWYGWRDTIMCVNPADVQMRDGSFIENESSAMTPLRGWREWTDVGGTISRMRIGSSMWNGTAAHCDDIVISEIRWYVFKNNTAKTPVYAGSHSSGNINTQSILQSIWTGRA